jgi:hypothetical protein
MAFLRKLIVLAVGCTLLAAAACGGGACNCGTGEVCTAGGICRTSCTLDAGDCPTGFVCQDVSGDCHGTAATCTVFPACVCGDGGC